MTKSEKKAHVSNEDSLNASAGQMLKKPAEPVDDEDYRPFDKEAKIKFLFIIVIPLVLVDLMTKEYLFDVSLPILKSIRENYATKGLDKFFSLVSEFGDRAGFIGVNIFSYYFLSLDRAFTVSLCVNASIALLSILKSVNHEARPFHVYEIQPSKCSFEFGNPSGHSLWCSTVYLCFWDMFCQQYKWRYGSRKHTSSFILTITIILLTSFSRIWHAVHTLNQLFSGFIWGFGLYYLFCYILYYEIRRFVQSIREMSWRKLVVNFGTKNFFFFLSLGTALYLIGSWTNPMSKEWQVMMEKNCAK